MVKRINWEVIKDFYKKEFGIENWMVELFANQDILLLCASGASNNTIHTFTEIPLQEVEEVIQNSFKFVGWGGDLPINPFGYYSMIMAEQGEVHMSEFMEELKEQCRCDFDYKQMYLISKTMWEIEKEIEDEWK
jgi:hypothetical protein